jgi:uncharacterized protein
MVEVGILMSGLDAMLALSAAHEQETGPLNHAKLTDMLGTAFHSATAGAGADGFLIAFDEASEYDGVNFKWFIKRYAKFVYIDRVIVAPHARGRGLARGFYEDLFDRARRAGHERVGCEINSDPPNPGSMAFHAALGFAEVGVATLENGKTVSYQVRML